MRCLVITDAGIIDHIYLHCPRWKLLTFSIEPLTIGQVSARHAYELCAANSTSQPSSKNQFILLLLPSASVPTSSEFSNLVLGVSVLLLPFG